MNAKDLMKNVADHFARSDLQPLYAAIDDNITWITGSSETGLFRFGGVYRGRSGVTELMAKLATCYHFSSILMKEIVAEGDVVWGTFAVDAGYAAKPAAPVRPVRFDYAVRWRVKNGKIIEHQGFFDTASLLAQQGELARA
jgi:ketosteroid isomerase-like protein